MIRGVSFQVPQGVIDTLWQILQPIDVTHYRWHNDERQYEVFPDEQGEDLFDKDCYTGQDFLARIGRKHFYLFLKLQAYFENGVFFEIQTYDEFQKSDCQILFLLYDCEWVEIFLKDKGIAEVLFQHAQRQNYKDVQYITNENDGRTGMNIRLLQSTNEAL